MKKLLALVAILTQIFLYSQVTDSTQVVRDSLATDSLSIKNGNSNTPLPSPTDTSFILKEIEITGTNKYSKNQIMRYTGLYEGDPIEIPSMQDRKSVV